MNRADRELLRFSRWVSLKLLWLFWILVALSVAWCVAVGAKLGGS